MHSARIKFSIRLTHVIRLCNSPGIIHHQHYCLDCPVVSKMSLWQSLTTLHQLLVYEIQDACYWPCASAVWQVMNTGAALLHTRVSLHLLLCIGMTPLGTIHWFKQNKNTSVLTMWMSYLKESQTKNKVTLDVKNAKCTIFGSNLNWIYK